MHNSPFSDFWGKLKCWFIFGEGSINILNETQCTVLRILHYLTPTLIIKSKICSYVTKSSNSPISLPQISMCKLQLKCFRLIWNLLGNFLDFEWPQWQICTAKQSVWFAGCVLLNLLFLCLFFPPLRFSKRTEKPEANFQVVAVLVSKVRVCFWAGESPLWPVEGVGERRRGAALGACLPRALRLRAPSCCEGTRVLSGKSS